MFVDYCEFPYDLPQILHLAQGRFSLPFLFPLSFQPSFDITSGLVEIENVYY